MKHASLFSGIGGFDLAAEWMGWENLFHCEWNPFCQTVLKHHFPNSVSYGDITKTDFTIWRERVDVLTGGFPCQPYSTAGKRLGKEDERHLWPEMLRAIREIAPRFVVGENVRGLLSWNGGMVFDEVQTDLEASGYEVLPFLLPACGVNAPHRRDRIWFGAYRNECAEGSPGKGGGIGSNGSRNHDEQKERGASSELDSRCGEFLRPPENSNSNGRASDIGQSESEVGRFGNIGSGDNEWVQADNGEVALAADGSNTRTKSDGREQKYEADSIKSFADTENTGLQACIERPGQVESRGRDFTMGSGQWDRFPTQSPVCTRDDGFSSRLDFNTVWGETNPRKPYITFSKWRQESIKAAGNAIVPQVALQIFKAIEMLKTNHHR